MAMDPVITKKRVLVVDDDLAFLGIVEQWLQHSGYDVSTAGGGLAAIPLARERCFDVIITDLRMPDLSGLQLLNVLKEIRPESVIIFLSGEGTMDEVIEALHFGRSVDFLRKPLKNLSLLNLAIESALQQRSQPLDSPSRAMGGGRIQQSDLSARELEVVALAAKGFDNKEIAERLCLSDKTVRNHLSRIYEKLAVTNRMQAVMCCKEHGLI